LQPFVQKAFSPKVQPEAKDDLPADHVYLPGAGTQDDQWVDLTRSPPASQQPASSCSPSYSPLYSPVVNTIPEEEEVNYVNPPSQKRKFNISSEKSPPPQKRRDILYYPLPVYNFEIE